MSIKGWNWGLARFEGESWVPLSLDQQGQLPGLKVRDGCHRHLTNRLAARCDSESWVPSSLNQQVNCQV